jgi:hypothetical protein
MGKREFIPNIDQTIDIDGHHLVIVSRRLVYFAEIFVCPTSIVHYRKIN